MEIKTIGVIGSGAMGSGIAQVAAQSGYQVVLQDIDDAFLEKGMGNIEKSLSRLVAKKTLLDKDKSATLKKITTTTKLDEIEKTDFVIEAITENEKVKLDLFHNLDEICRESVVMTSNTSSISITKIAGATWRPQKIAGMHFMNPVPLMKLVEGIRGLVTSDETFKIVRMVAESMGKTFVESKDSPGFTVNRILVPMINEAVYTLYEGLATRDDIDTAMKLGTNQPMGPLELADFVGLDVCLAVLEVLYRDFADSKYRPCPLLRKYVDAGFLGRKSGRGFYEYSKK